MIRFKLLFKSLDFRNFIKRSLKLAGEKAIRRREKCIFALSKWISLNWVRNTDKRKFLFILIKLDKIHFVLPLAASIWSRSTTPLTAVWTRPTPAKCWKVEIFGLNVLTKLFHAFNFVPNHLDETSVCVQLSSSIGVKSRCFESLTLNNQTPGQNSSETP